MIIRINEKREASQKNASPKGVQKEIKGDEGILDPKDRVFKQASYLRSVYEGTIDGCSPQSGTGETLP